MVTDILQMGLILALTLALAWPLGQYIAKVFQGERTFFDRAARPVERLLYRIAAVDPDQEMDWKQYAGALLAFNILGLVVLFLMQRLQGILPFNPQGFGPVPGALAFNTAASFVTNTNWQAYSGESTMSYLTQMAGLTVQNFVSAATGVAVVIALIRGLVRKTTRVIGNFWVDLTRAVLWVLLPLSLVLAVGLASQGVIQNLHPYQTVQTLEGRNATLAMGPVASQEAIKELGTNGGGFFNANSSHPFENPSPLTNVLEIIGLLLIPAALTFSFGRMVGDRRQGYVILGAMLLLFLTGLGVAYFSEAGGNPQIAALGVSGPTAMEGKEVRFGVGNSVLFATATTATSCGAVNAMHDSLTPLGGFVPLFQMMLGEVIFGGVGAGLYSILIFVILAVFIVGLMVGRTPEYLGKKIESGEVKMAVLAIIIPSALILVGGASAVLVRAGLASISNPGPHGLSQVLYAFASAAGNNGSAFAGLNANTPFYNLLLGMVMFIGRFGVILPVLAIAGSLAGKKHIPVGPGTFQTRGVLFSGVLIGTIIIVGALTFFPALALGPIIEQLLLNAGKLF
ncbi:K+-transporting ATPase ATPase A chain [Hydrogenispora ethanolica]|uniref:Potassium-transporting ATPase potassium-binding subunit n=1 Tax=Hydrogenispora ethanolica TaxID=1082276 RepID=A0A4R1S7R9_HYDET|nr:potassium-transporting ATPase subunit KdpA [Hydrogenispora ethanolica]TCL75309.1 K+-transporting ATPase ATPase A chain [Hydrogenispora ethanolica]